MKLTKLLSFAASLVLVPFIFSSCDDKPVEPDTPGGGDEKITLEVTPSSKITFKAKQNKDVILTVKTNAPSWDFTAPEWIVATKEDNTLKVNAKDNVKKEDLVGRIEFTAGDAKKVRITVMQSADSEEPEAQAGEGMLVNKDGKNTLSIKVTKDTPTHKAELIVKLGEPAKTEMSVKVKLDPEYLNEYNHTNNTEFISLPSEAVNLGTATLTIPAGQTESAPLEVNLDLTSVKSSTNYLATIAVDETALPEGLVFPVANKRFNIAAIKLMEKKVKNIVYLAVNNTNPLNLLEYRLEDGTPFFDVAILFAANIRYDSGRDMVKLHNNANVQALLNETDTYLQPLRNAGIKVQLGLLPDWTAAGLTNLSDLGAEAFAQQVVKAVKDYKLDGVSLDEEYTSGFETSPYLDPKLNGMRLVYQLYTQMKEQISWATEISIFDFSWDGFKAYKGMTPGQMVNQIVPNYYDSVSSEWEGVTNSQKAGYSMECNDPKLNASVEQFDNAKAKQLVNDGYGWCMWFAFHPQDGGGITNNANKIDPRIEIAAQEFYGSKLAKPQYYYTKIAEGKYSPEKIVRNF